jgi:predicted secreted protein
MPGLWGFGTQLEQGDGATPEVFTPIANITNISLPAPAVDTYDVTSHDSPTRYREFVNGLIDAGEVSCDINYDPEEHDTIMSGIAASEVGNFRITFPSGAQWAFAAVITGFEASVPIDDKMSGSLTFKVSGAVTATPATP